VSERAEKGTTSRSPSAAFRHTLACLALAGLCLAVFGNTLRNQFVSYDDWFLIEENQRIRSLSPASIARMLTSKDPNSHAWLPLRELSYALDYRIWGLTPVGYHLTNVLFHAANGALCYAVLLWLLGRPSLALLGAAGFLVHPVQAESVAWASGRRDVLYAFFYLLAFLAFVEHERREGRLRWALYGASLACLGASLLSKASAMTLPAALALAVLVRGGPEEDGRLWRRLLATVPHWALAIALTAAHTVIAREAGVVKGQAFEASLANVPLIFAKYWRLLFFPVHLATPHADSSLRWAADGPRIALLAAVWVAVVVAAWWAAPRRSVALFGLGWWFVLLLPVANFVPISVLVAERYLYLPLVGACAVSADIVGRLASAPSPWRRSLARACAGVVLGLLALAAHSRNRVWVNSRVFWQDGVSKWPGIPLMRIGLATAYTDANDYERAWRQYMEVALSWGRAASRDPEHLSLANRGLAGFYDALARAREARGDNAGALEVYETMVRLQPNEVEPWERLVAAYERMGEQHKAVEARLKLAGVLEKQGLYARAREQVLAVQEQDPSHEGLSEWLRRLEAAEEDSDSGGERQGPKE